jgi:8-oxo-dGTP pyrophosphatase MutT (NUDIX family)
MNKELYDKQYVIPERIVNSVAKALLVYPTGDGVRRANMIKSGSISYQALERLKHDFDHMDLNNPDEKIKYILAGGDYMKYFVDTTLNSERAGVQMKKDATMDKSDIHQGSKIQTINENDEKKVRENAIVIVVNGSNQILLGKRSDESKWGAGKYALIGGAIENKETPEEACRREVLEETGLVLGNFIESYKISRDGNTEYVFVTRYNGNGTDVKLNEEHSAYGWFDFDEIKKIDTVPVLMEYLMLCFKPY